MDLTEAVTLLYAAPSDGFVATRKELVTAARKADDRTLAGQIAELRKPTVAAAVVNRQVHEDPSTLERLTEVGDRLRAAQGAAGGIDRELLRELSVERRTLVRDVSAQALERFDASAGPAIQDEVIATFDAAVADPDVAARLGRLTHAEQWSGFGVVSDAVPGPRPTKARQRDAPVRPQLAAAEKKLSAAQGELDEADAVVSTAQAKVDELTQKLDGIEHDLAAAQKDAKAAASTQRSARSRHRAALAERNRVARRDST